MGGLSQLQSLIQSPGAWRKLPFLALVALGWLLSPLCWWNDLLINLPIAFGFAKLVSLFQPSWLLPALVAGYWLSNVAGVLLMQNGALALMPGDRKSDGAKDLMWGLLTSSLYTAAIVVAVKLGWLGQPQFEAFLSAPQGLAG